jgi:hypothetical protein
MSKGTARSIVAIRIMRPPLAERGGTSGVIGRPDRIEDDVGAASVGQLAHPLGDVGARGVDDIDRAAGMARIGLVAAHRPDDPRAQHGRDLGGRLPDLAVDAQDQHCLAACRHAGPQETLPGGDEGHADRAGLHHGQPRRLGAHGIGLHHHVGCVRPVATDAEIAARSPDLRTDEIGGALHDHAGEIAAGRAWPDRVRHHAERRLDVGRVDGGSMDFHQDLAGAGPGDG